LSRWPPRTAANPSPRRKNHQVRFWCFFIFPFGGKGLPRPWNFGGAIRIRIGALLEIVPRRHPGLVPGSTAP
jgi:hypothetical protein